MEKCSFFNAELIDGEYDRVYLAEDYARYFSSFIGNGVFPNPSSNLKVVASGENMKVTVKAGKAWINGYYYENDSDLTLIIDNADGVLNRIDRIVVCLDHLKREINVKIKKGDYSSNPIPKEITRNDDIYELALADIKVNNGFISIQNSYISDLRLNKELCGVVCGTVHEVDTTDIFNTYQNYLNERMNSNEFDEWFNGLKNKLNPEEDDENFKNAVDLLFEELEAENPNHFAVRQYKKYKLAAGKTAKSILISCGARLAPFDIKELRDLMEYDELELDTIGEKKTALFVIISDTDATFNFVVSIMYSQLFNLLCDKADDVYNGRLPVHVRMLLDEFANIGQIPQFEKLIATIRSREISASIILQSKSQLKAIYKDNADTIEGNCDTTLFLGGKEKTTLKELAEVLGKETIDLYNTSDTRGTSQSYGLNYQKTGKELMSQDEIAVMDGGKCIMQLRGVRPFFSDKFDITKHKRYRELSDYDPKNAFDIEKYVKHLHHMKVTPNTQVDEAFDCGEVNRQEEHSSNTTE